MTNGDQYLTIKAPSVGEPYKSKGSKFLGFAYPVFSESMVRDHLKDLKKSHHSARHWCYAYQIGTEAIRFRANDDGEPSNSAGQPILGQIRSAELTDILVVVVRYYGGTKLGVGGLITAYKTAAAQAIEEADIITRFLTDRYELSFDYPLLNKVNQILRQHQVEVLKRQMETTCRFMVEVRRGKKDEWQNSCQSIYGLHWKEVDT